MSPQSTNLRPEAATARQAVRSPQLGSANGEGFGYAFILIAGYKFWTRFVEKMLRPLCPEHHLSPALSPTAWRRGRRIAPGFFVCLVKIELFSKNILDFGLWAGNPGL